MRKKETETGGLCALQRGCRVATLASIKKKTSDRSIGALSLSVWIPLKHQEPEPATSEQSHRTSGRRHAGPGAGGKLL